VLRTSRLGSNARAIPEDRSLGPVAPGETTDAMEPVVLD
jgi:hypothetical protein